MHPLDNPLTDQILDITALGTACYDGDVIGVRRLLASGADPNERVHPRDGWTITPLIVALDACANDCVRALLQAGADPDVLCEDFDCSLHGRARCTPLLLADVMCNAPAKRMLLAHGADPALADRLGISTKTFQPDRNVRAEFLISGRRVRRMILGNRKLSAIEAALKTVRDLDEKGGMLLTAACQARRLDVLELLCAYRADPNQMRLTFVEADGGSGEIAAILLRQGYNAQTQLHGSPLVEACAKGSSRIVELLLDYGADLDVALRCDDLPLQPTPLIAAIATGQIECVEILLKRGAHPKLCHRGFPKLENYPVGSTNFFGDWLRYSGWEDEPRQTACPPILVACGAGFPTAVELLLKFGASRNERDSDGRDALAYISFVTDLQVRRRIEKLLANPPVAIVSPTPLF